MIVNKISTCTMKNSINSKNVSPTFNGMHTTICKPNIRCQNGQVIYEKVLKYIDQLPSGSRMFTPALLKISETDAEKTYGIIVDKKNNNMIGIVIKNLTNNKDWGSVNDTKDVLSAAIDKNLGRMLAGEYNDMHFYRHSNKRDRRIETNGSRFSPTSCGSENWGMTVYGGKSKTLDKTGCNSDPLGSIFWAMTEHNASINCR